jgi:hypothetical protein
MVILWLFQGTKKVFDNFALYGNQSEVSQAIEFHNLSLFINLYLLSSQIEVRKANVGNTTNQSLHWHRLWQQATGAQMLWQEATGTNANFNMKQTLTCEVDLFKLLKILALQLSLIVFTGHHEGQKWIESSNSQRQN